MTNQDDSGRRRFLKAGIAVAAAAGAGIVGESLARAADPPEKDGTLLRGADGKLYFVPDDALKPFAVDDRKSAALDARFGEGMKAAAVNLPGKDVADSGVAARKSNNVLLMNIGLFRGGATTLTAKIVPAPGAKEVPATKK